jgi:type II secretion system protein N
MAEKTIATWKLALAYSVFALFSLVVGVMLTFPYDVLKSRVRSAAEEAGYQVDMASLGPGFFSVRATRVELKKAGDANKTAEPLRLDSVSVSPTLFPPGVSVSARALGGSLNVRAGGLSGVRVKVDAEDLDLSKGNMKGFTGMDLSGTVDAHVDLTVPASQVGSGPSEPDLSAAGGTVKLETHGVAVNGGSLNIPLPGYGPEPVPLDLPKIVLGDLSGSLKFEKGLGTVEELKSHSADLDLQVTGTLKLAKRAEYSEPNLDIRVKADPEFQKRLGLVGSALSMIAADGSDPSWRKGKLTGSLGRPQFR